jgi:hypothetical protein
VHTVRIFKRSEHDIVPFRIQDCAADHLFCSGRSAGASGRRSEEIVRQALRNDTRNRELERSYTYTLREETRKLDSGNAVKSTESKTWEVIPLAGGPRSAA